MLASTALAARVAAAVSANTNRTPYIGRRGLGYNDVSMVDGGILPKEVTLVHVEEDGVTPIPSGVAPPAKIPFRLPRYKKVLENVSANISDHCPVKVWF